MQPKLLQVFVLLHPLCEAARFVDHNIVAHPSTGSSSSSFVATGADQEAEDIADAEGILLPDCHRSLYAVETAAADAYSWCNADSLPTQERPPKKLQGLYWLKGLPMSDVMACFSTGKWNAQTLTLEVQAYPNFIYRDTYSALGTVSKLYSTGLTYRIKFESSDLTKADITSVGAGLGTVPVFFYNQLHDVELHEIEGTNGMAWSRPSYVGFWPFRWEKSRYEMIKVLDGAGNIIKGHHSEMVGSLQEQDLSGLVRFPAQCDEEEHASMNTASPGSATCHAGVFVTFAKQAELGIAYKDDLQGTFAQFETKRGCVVNYTASCWQGFLYIKSATSCPEKKRLLKMPKSSREGAFKDYWEVCHDAAGVLSSTKPLVSQMWSSIAPAKTPVDGCIRLLPAHAWPELDGIRGTLEEQTAAVTQRKKEVGGCPLFRNEKDRRNRGNDIKGMSTWLNIIQRFQRSRAEGWKEGSNSKNTIGNYVDLGFLGVAAKQNRTTGFMTFSAVNCGEPSPFVDGPQVFRYSDVVASIKDPAQVRTYSTSTLPQTEECFQRTIPLFSSSDNVDHTEFRRMLDEVGFATMHETSFPDVTARVPDKGAGEEAPTEKDVGRQVLERVMLAVWGKRPNESIVEAVLPYLDKGKLCIFGQGAKDLWLLREEALKQISQVRSTNAKFGLEAPTMQKVKEVLPKYPGVQAKYTEDEAADASPSLERVATDIGDAVLFAGLLGTTDMSTKCIQYQWRDHKHVAMYRKDKAAYLHELMRYDGAVTSFTTALKEDEVWNLEGLQVPLKKGTPVQMSLGVANRDKAVFKNPAAFDPERSDIMDQVSWNGRLEDVMARNYSGAPRFCPGYHTSMKIAMQVCDHYTQHLSEYSSEVSSYISGTVEILKAGDWQGRQGLVSYFDFKKQKHCLIDKEERPTMELGCFKSSELKVIDPTPTFPRTWLDEAETCPSFTGSLVSMLAHRAVDLYDVENSFISGIFEKLIGKDESSAQLSSDWSDDYSTAFYSAMLHLSLRKYVTRRSEDINIPKRTGQAETFRVGDVIAPNMDIDDIDLEFSLADYFDGVLPNDNCVQNFLRNVDVMNDTLHDPLQNTWEIALKSGNYARKKDWVLAFWSMYKAADSSPVWPAPELDFAQLFLKGDMWDDRLESAMAFDLIGTHRVETSTRTHKGELLPFVVKLNDFSKLAVREGFGIYEGDMYFTRDAMPAVIVLSSGEVVEKGDKQWQYWKFVWRSCLTTIITVVDHLHMTHFKVANFLARASRRVLSPDHPVRRLMSIFTFGTIQVNVAAMHALVGPRHSLERSAPFVSIESLADTVPKMLPDILVQTLPLHSEKAFAALPARLQTAPYYADGRLLFKALQNLVKDFVNVYYSEFCDEASHDVVEDELVEFRDALVLANELAETEGTTSNHTSCEELSLRTAAGLWMVTGWHRHVGTVADYFGDPDLAGFSWKDGERFPRPKHTLILSVIAAFTGTKQPKLTQNYTHVFHGMHKEEEAVAVWNKFQNELKQVKEQVRQHNMQRGEVTNYHADPDIVECSVAV